jgi:hypothetical protein
MNTSAKMVQVAAECIKRPRQHAVWHPERGEYLSRDPEKVAGVEPGASRQPVDRPETPPPLSSQFKLVFVSALGGILLFVLICVVVTLASGRELASAEEKLVQGLFDLAKIGFGSVVGLLGSKAL